MRDKRTALPSTDRRTGKPATTAGHVVVLALVALTAAGAGCKSIQPATTGSGGNGSSGSGGGNGSGGSGNDASVEQVVVPDMAMEHFMSGDSMTTDGACAATTSQAMLVPLDLYVVMDSSKSMNETDSAGNPKWTDLKQAMASFFIDPNSQGFNVALTYFPDEQSGVPEVCNSDADCGSNGPCDQRKACVGSTQFSTAPSTLCSNDADCVAAGDGDSCVAVQTCPRDAQCNQRNCVQGPNSTGTCPSGCVAFTGYCRGRDICDPNDYAMPKVSFGSLSDSSVVQKLNDSLNSHSPGGYTPTGPALTGALQAAQQHAKDSPDHKTVVVLLTDGLPGAFIPNKAPSNCTPPDVAGVASLLMTGAMGDSSGTPPIQTFIIGVFGPCDLTDKNVNPQTNLDSWAAAGGTMKSVIVDTSQDVTSKILDAFKQVQSTVITCQYAIPKKVVGGINFDKTQLDFTSTAMTTPATVAYVGTKDKCDPNSGGWYYDSPNPDTTAPTQIIACDKSCTDFKAAAGAKVEITSISRPGDGPPAPGGHLPKRHLRRSGAGRS